MNKEETRQGALDRVLDTTELSDSMPADLFAVVDALESSPTLRRALSDPGTAEDGRETLARGLLEGKVSPAAVDLVAAAVRMRWAGGRTLASALERQAVRAVMRQAESAQQLEEVEDELFRFARLVESSSALRNSLSDRSAGTQRRQTLVSDLLEGKAAEPTVLLGRRAVLARERTFSHTLEGYIGLAADQKDRVIATVRVAQPISTDQAERLRVALTRQVGRDIALQVVVDPQVLGGARIELGNEIIEGTVGARLDEARRLFT